jgi:hypothetical protein
LGRLAKDFFIRAVAAASLATALSFNFFGASQAGTRVVADGLPTWLEAHVTRGLSVVWSEIPAGARRLETLSLVAQRLFSGYGVTVTADEGGSPRVLFEALTPVSWDVVPTVPNLRTPTAEWFARDCWELEDEVGPLLEGLPVEALSWADSALRGLIKEIVERRLPGWDFSLLVRVGVAQPTLQISFHARQPLVLAISPSIFSSTLPVMFQADLRAKLISGLSPFIGLPVEWITRHRAEAGLLAREFLEDRNAVSNTRSRVEISFVPGQVSQVDAAVNSETLIFQVWVAAYVGMEERYPEAGFLAGWNTKRLTRVDLELYNETIVGMGDFSLTSRLGLRFPALRGLRAGAEVEWPEGGIWYRAWWEPRRIRRPYAWWRYSGDYGHSGAVGYRVSEYISVEILYDNRYDDKVGLRGIMLL